MIGKNLLSMASTMAIALTLDTARRILWKTLRVSRAIDLPRCYGRGIEQVVLDNSCGDTYRCRGVITAVGGIYAVTRPGPQFEPSKVATVPSTRPTAQKLWQKNWLTVSQPRGSLGSGGREWTNRDQLLAMLRALDIPQDDPLLTVREQLLTLAVATPEDLSNGPNWSLPYSLQMKHMEEDLRRGIRDRAIEHNVAVDSGN